MTKGSQAMNEPGTEEREPDLQKLVEQIFRQLDSPARVMELYYWSREPGLLDIIRSIIAMPAHTRDALEAFLTMAGDPETVAAGIDNAGRLTLSSPQIGQAIELIREDHAGMVPEIAHSTH
jgi:hypothetical protein